MKILIAIGMVIVFISVFFVLLLGNAVFTSSFSCVAGSSGTVCEFSGFSGPALASLFMIAFFVAIDAFSVYLIISNLSNT